VPPYLAAAAFTFSFLHELGNRFYSTRCSLGCVIDSRRSPMSFSPFQSLSRALLIVCHFSFCASFPVACFGFPFPVFCADVSVGWFFSCEPLISPPFDSPSFFSLVSRRDSLAEFRPFLTVSRKPRRCISREGQRLNCLASFPRGLMSFSSLFPCSRRTLGHKERGRGHCVAPIFSP